MVTIGLHVLWPSFFIFSKSDLVMLERFFGKEVDLIYNVSDVLRVPHRLVGRGHEES